MKQTNLGRRDCLVVRAKDLSPAQERALYLAVNTLTEAGEREIEAVRAEFGYLLSAEIGFDVELIHHRRNRQPRRPRA